MKIILQGGKIKIPTKGHMLEANKPYPLKEVLGQVSEGLVGKITNSEKLQHEIEEVYLARVELDYMFKVKGCDDFQQITVTHHDQPELLTIIVDIDENGGIKEISDNDKESLFSEEMVAVMSGDVLKDFKPIVSALPEGVTCHETISIANFDIVIYTEKDEPNIAWVQYFQQGQLIQEVKIKLEEGQTVQDVINKYKNI